MYFLELSENPWDGGIPHKKESLKTKRAFQLLSMKMTPASLLLYILRCYIRVYLEKELYC